MKMNLSNYLSSDLPKLISRRTLALFILLACTAEAYSSTNEGYQITQISPEPYTQIIQRTGKIDFARVVNLSFKTTGFLTELKIDEGDVFDEKQLLAALDTSELRAEKNATYARLLQAKRNIARVKTLMKKNLSSQHELDDALTAVETARAAYRVAYYNLDKSQIYAPFNGVVLKRNTELGELQSPGVGALQVANLLNNLIVSVALTSEEISLVHLGQKVKVHITHLGIIEGQVSKIPAIADSRSHLFTIEVALSDTSISKSIIVGQLAEIIIYSQSQIFVYRLPIEALNAVNKHGQALIAVEKNNKAQQQAHTIFKMDNDFLYLQSHENSNSIDVITQGWNKLSLDLVE